MVLGNLARAGRFTVGMGRRRRPGSWPRVGAPRWAGFFVSAFVLVFGSVGCLQSDTLIRLHADGSGEIEVLTLLPEAALEQAREMARAFAPEGEEVAEPDLFPSEELAARASDFGEGVRFVRSEPVSKDGSVGARAIYAFDDITKLAVSMEPGDSNPGLSPGGADVEVEPGGEPDPHVTFAFGPGKDGRKLLQIRLPKGDFDEAEGGEIAAEGEGDAASEEEARTPSDEELAFITEMFGGFRFGLALETDGKIVRTNSPYAEGNRLTIFDVDFGKIIADLPKFKEVAGRGEPSSMTEAAAWLREFEGIKVHLEENLEVEFEAK